MLSWGAVPLGTRLTLRDRPVLHGDVLGAVEDDRLHGFWEGRHFFSSFFILFFFFFFPTCSLFVNSSGTVLFPCEIDSIWVERREK